MTNRKLQTPATMSFLDANRDSSKASTLPTKLTSYEFFRRENGQQQSLSSPKSLDKASTYSGGSLIKPGVRLKVNGSAFSSSEEEEDSELIVRRENHSCDDFEENGTVGSGIRNSDGQNFDIGSSWTGHQGHTPVRGNGDSGSSEQKQFSMVPKHAKNNSLPSYHHLYSLHEHEVPSGTSNNDNRRSSISSELGLGGELSNLSRSSFRGSTPTLFSGGTGRRESVVEEIEKKRRESVSNRLKGLQLPSAKRSSLSAAPCANMPIIVASKPLSGNVLPKSRRASYQPVSVNSPARPSSAAPRVVLLPPERRNSVQDASEDDGRNLSCSSLEFPIRNSHSLTSINNDEVSPKLGNHLEPVENSSLGYYGFGNTKGKDLPENCRLDVRKESTLPSRTSPPKWNYNDHDENLTHCKQDRDSDEDDREESSIEDLDPEVESKRSGDSGYPEVEIHAEFEQLAEEEPYFSESENPTVPDNESSYLSTRLSAPEPTTSESQNFQYIGQRQSKLSQKDQQLEMKPDWQRTEKDKNMENTHHNNTLPEKSNDNVQKTKSIFERHNESESSSLSNNNRKLNIVPRAEWTTLKQTSPDSTFFPLADFRRDPSPSSFRSQNVELTGTSLNKTTPDSQKPSSRFMNSRSIFESSSLAVSVPLPKSSKPQDSSKIEALLTANDHQISERWTTSLTSSSDDSPSNPTPKLPSRGSSPSSRRSPMRSSPESESSGTTTSVLERLAVFEPRLGNRQNPPPRNSIGRSPLSSYTSDDEVLSSNRIFVATERAECIMDLTNKKPTTRTTMNPKGPWYRTTAALSIAPTTATNLDRRVPNGIVPTSGSLFRMTLEPSELPSEIEDRPPRLPTSAQPSFLPKTSVDSLFDAINHDDGVENFGKGYPKNSNKFQVNKDEDEFPKSFSRELKHVERFRNGSPTQVEHLVTDQRFSSGRLSEGMVVRKISPSRLSGDDISKPIWSRIGSPDGVPSTFSNTESDSDSQTSSNWQHQSRVSAKSDSNLLNLPSAKLLHNSVLRGDPSSGYSQLNNNNTKISTSPTRYRPESCSNFRDKPPLSETKSTSGRNFESLSPIHRITGNSKAPDTVFELYPKEHRPSSSEEVSRSIPIRVIRQGKAADVEPDVRKMAQKYERKIPIHVTGERTATSVFETNQASFEKSTDRIEKVERNIPRAMQLPRSCSTLSPDVLKSPSPKPGYNETEIAPEIQRVSDRIVDHESSTSANKQDYRSITNQRASETPVLEAIGSREGGLIDVEIVKGALGLSFCVEGGKGSASGDKPITVKRLFRSLEGSSAAKDVLHPGDEIVSANGRDLSLLSHYVAWNYLKSLPEGVVTLAIRRSK